MKIQVTTEDIEHGIRNDCVDCPVARAVTRTLQTDVDIENGYVIVYERQVTLHGPLPSFDRYDLPRTVWQKIVEYDVTGQMEPFEFDLKLVEEG